MGDGVAKMETPAFMPGRTSIERGQISAMSIPDEKRRQCNDGALFTFGTAYIFEKGAARIRLALRLLTFTGLVVPASLGILVGTIGCNSKYISLAIIFAALLSGTQLVLSIWSLVANLCYATWRNTIKNYCCGSV